MRGVGGSSAARPLFELPHREPSFPLPASTHSRSYRSLSSFALAWYGADSSSVSAFHAAPISFDSSGIIASGFAALNSSRLSLQ